MIDFIKGLTSFEKLFFYLAFLGGIVFVIRLLMVLIGGSLHDGDGDMDSAADMAADGIDSHMDGAINSDHHDTDASFKIFTIQGMSTFFMMTGVVGLVLSRYAKAAPLWIALGGLLGGVLSVWMMGKLLMQMQKLQADGTMDIKNALFKEGEVYLTIPATGEGKVMVAVQGSLREFTAVSSAKEEIKTGEKILVVNILGQNTLIVKKKTII
jgi:membrane protein implicated in regulation of membrane protease activity